MIYVICPRCKRKIGSYEIECPFCEFPLQTYLHDSGIEDLKKKIMCTRCGKQSNGLTGAIELKCDYCDIPMVQLMYNEQEFSKMYNDSLDGIAEKVMENLEIDILELERMIQRKDPRIMEEMTRIKGGNPYAIFLKRQFPSTFDINAFEGREAQEKREAEARLPRCPRCGSTNIKKLRKFVDPNMVKMGLVGSADFVPFKSYRCNNCRHTW